MTADAKLQKISPKKQISLNNGLIEAAKCGDTKKVEALLASGADVHAGNDDALGWAAFWGHTETVKVLLAAGADVHAQGGKSMIWAAKRDCTETVHILQTAIKDQEARRLELERQQNALLTGTGLTFAESRPEDMDALLREAMAEQSLSVSALALDVSLPSQLLGQPELAQPGRAGQPKGREYIALPRP